jgi:Virulence factor
MAKLIVIRWRDIPAQVVVKKGRETVRLPLASRFQEAVDRAAMRAGKTSSQAYIADWQRSEPRDCGDDLQAEAAAEVARLEAHYTDDELLRLIRAHGIDAEEADDAEREADSAAAPGTPPDA